MNTFIKKTVLFFLVLFALTAVIYLFISYTNKKAILNYRTDPAINTMIIGDSHVQYAINDNLLSNTINLCQDSESFLFSFYKLQWILQNNNAITRVYLGFGYHSLSSYFDDYITGKFSRDIASRYFFIIPDREKRFFIDANSKQPGIFFSRIFLNSFKTAFVNSSSFSFLGRYQNSYKYTSANIQSMDKRATQQYYINDTLRGFSTINIYYLQKIVDLCKKKNVELVVLNTPLHPYYKNKIPQKFIDKYNELIINNSLKQIDFSALSFSDSCFIPDGDHVSERGAIITSIYLKNAAALKN